MAPMRSLEPRQTCNSGGYNGAMFLNPLERWLIGMDQSYSRWETDTGGRVLSNVKSTDAVLKMGKKRWGSALQWLAR
eukprot:13098582-Ditylum_brightwellii.AAC.2